MKETTSSFTRGKTSNALAASRVLAILAALPSAAFAQSGDTAATTSLQSTPPIAIESCGPALDTSPGQTVAGFALAAKSRGMHVQFTNESRKTAALVNFAVTSNGEQFIIRDVGTFSPGVSIDHSYRNGAGRAFVLPAFIAPKVSCDIASVKFTDGSVWRRGQAAVAAAQPAQNAPNPPHAPATLSASPAHLSIDRATDSELFLVSGSERVTAFQETDDCAAVASVFVVATGQASATYSVRPIAPGGCTARVTDEAGNVLAVPIVVL